MKRLSTKGIYIYKRILPAFWFGLIIILTISSLGVGRNSGVSLSLLIMPILMGVLGYLLMKHNIFNLIDEVYDEGGSILFRNGLKEVRIPLSEIKSISYVTWSNPPRVTTCVRHETQLGRELTFCPSAPFVPSGKNRDIQNLIGRIEKQQAGQNNIGDVGSCGA